MPSPQIFPFPSARSLYDYLHWLQYRQGVLIMAKTPMALKMFFTEPRVIRFSSVNPALGRNVITFSLSQLNERRVQGSRLLGGQSSFHIAPSVALSLSNQPINPFMVKGEARMEREAGRLTNVASFLPSFPRSAPQSSHSDDANSICARGRRKRRARLSGKPFAKYTNGWACV